MVICESQIQTDGACDKTLHLGLIQSVVVRRRFGLTAFVAVQYVLPVYPARRRRKIIVFTLFILVTFLASLTVSSTFL